MKNSFLNKFDLSWLSINFGMAIGAGVVMAPITAASVGIPIFLISILIAFPGIYLFQKLFITTLFANDKPKVYSEVIYDLLGKKWEVFLSILYLLMMIIWTTIYAEIVAQVLSSYMHSLGITLNLHLAENPIFSFILVCILMFLGFKSENLLVKAVTFFAGLLVIAIIASTVTLVPMWHSSNLTYIPNDSSSVSKLIMLMPFSLTSILFIQSLSPMVIGYREKFPEDKEFAKQKTVKGMKVAFILLAVIIFSFICSFALAIPHNLAIFATEHNQSAFIALEKANKSNTILVIFGTVINICAIMTSFLSILAGMKNSLKGFLNLIIKHFFPESRCDKRNNLLSIIIIFLLAWLSIVFQLPIYKILPLSAPIFGVIGCLMPVYLVYKIPSLQKYKTKSIYFILAVGILLIISPIFS